MNNALITINGIRGFIDNSGTAQLNLEDVSRGLGFVETKGDYIRWQRVESYLEEFKFSICGESKNRPEFIPENIFYRLAMKAKSEAAEIFQGVVADEILPTIRKTGAYITEKASPEMLRRKANELESLETANEAVKIISSLVDACDLPEINKLLSAKAIYKKAGVELPIEVKLEQKLYDLDTIAKKIGIISENGNPHSNAVSAIIKQLDIPDKIKIDVLETNGKWTGSVTKYNEEIFEYINKWLEDNNYPKEVQSNNRRYKIKYQKVNV